MEYSREIIKSNQDIVLYEKMGNNLNPKNFHIVDVISDDGGFAIAYKAYHENSSNVGVLREYYPKDETIIFSVKRDSENKIFLDTEEINEAERIRFIESRDEYLAPYMEIKKVQIERGSKDDEESLSFIPHYEIYYGHEDIESNGTVYFWTPFPEVHRFNQVCEEVQQNPEKNPEYSLYSILTSIMSLAKSLREVHLLGYVHRDIKPSNFGYIKNTKSDPSNAVSIFDIDSICPTGTKSGYGVYSEGFTDKRTRGIFNPDNRFDIYSVGATLFFAIINTDEIRENGFLYNDDYFDRLEELVNESKLIKYSERNSHPRLRQILTKILKNSLCEISKRYLAIELLIKDLEVALGYVMPNEMLKRKYRGDNWVISDVRKWFSEDSKKSIGKAIKYNLYDIPLYNNLSTKDSKLNVLVLGVGKYAFSFIDTCLELSQNLYGQYTKIMVLSNNSDVINTDEELFIQERPAINKFFNVGKNEKVADSYGDIVFQSDDILQGEREITLNEEKIKTLISNEEFNYAFIDLQSKELNERAKKLLESVNEKAPVIYLDEENWKNQGKDSKEIKRMAFNAHSIWDDNTDIDFEMKYSNFLDAYNFESSLSFILSVKYKLWSVGIDIEKISLYRGAKEFSRLKVNNPEFIDNLAWAEHKRWVTEKLCQGYVKRSKKYWYLGTQDRVKKNHICLVKSKKGRALFNIPQNDWDKADFKVDSFDELDRVSVNIHRFYLNQMEGFRVTQFPDIEERLIETTAYSDYLEWKTSLNSVLQSQNRQGMNYCKARWEIFKRTLKNEKIISKTNYNYITETLESYMTPLLNRFAYIDYKQYDYELIEKIPYILTNKFNVSLCVPIQNINGKSQYPDYMFSRLAGITTINPMGVVFVFVGESKDDKIFFEKFIIKALNYMDSKRLQGKVTAYYYYKGNKPKNLNSTIKEKCIRDCDIRCININDNSSSIKEINNSKNEMIVDMPDEYKGNFWSKMLKNVPSFKYDKNKNLFAPDNSCYWIKFLELKKPLKVKDILCLIDQESSINSINLLGRKPFNKLWEIYEQDKLNWKTFQNYLKEKEDKNKTLCVIQKNSVKKQDFNFYTSSENSKILKYIIKECVEAGNIIENYSIEYCSSSTIYLSIKCTKELGVQLQEIFSDPEKLKNINEPLVENREKTIVFKYSDVPSYIGKVESINNKKYEILKKLSEAGFIYGLKKDENIYKFSYATQEVRNTLRKGGNILELRVYYDLLESGLFDSVETEVDFKENDYVKKHELDCVVIKGFKEIIIECKAIDYIKIRKLTEIIDTIQERRKLYGVNSKGVIIYDGEIPKGFKEKYKIPEGIYIKSYEDIVKENSRGIVGYIQELL